MSEFLSNVASSVVGMLYNAQLMDYAGEQGVAAYGVLMYVCFIFFAIFIGYSMGVAPIIGYHYGAKNREEVKSVFRKSLLLVSVTSLTMTCLCLVLSRPLALLFVGYNAALVELTVRAFIFYAFVFLFAGLGIYGSSFFTALNNGFISAFISFLRVVVFQVAAVMLFPLVWQTDGIWLSVVFAEFAALIVTIICLLANKKKYGY
jgi:Na+-driven multidrug efflux pump